MEFLVAFMIPNKPSDMPMQLAKLELDSLEALESQSTGSPQCNHNADLKKRLYEDIEGKSFKDLVNAKNGLIHFIGMMQLISGKPLDVFVR